MLKQCPGTAQRARLGSAAGTLNRGWGGGPPPRWSSSPTEQLCRLIGVTGGWVVGWSAKAPSLKTVMAIDGQMHLAHDNFQFESQPTARHNKTATTTKAPSANTGGCFGLSHGSREWISVQHYRQMLSVVIFFLLVNVFLFFCFFNRELLHFKCQTSLLHVFSLKSSR